MITITTLAPTEVAQFFAQQGEEFAPALQRVMGAVEKKGVVFSPFGDAYRARYDGWLVPADEVVSVELTDWLSSQSFYEWVGVSGYDTRPHYRAPNGRVSLPVAHSVGYADGREGADYGGHPEVLLTIVETLHTLGVDIVIPDYSGCNLEGETRWTPTEYGAWAQSYEDFRG